MEKSSFEETDLIQDLSIKSNVTSEDSVDIFNRLPTALKDSSNVSLFLLFAYRIISSLPVPIFADYVTNLGWTSDDVGILGAIHTLTLVGSTFFSNYFSSISYKKTIIAFLILNAFSFLIFVYGASTRSFSLLIFSRFILGFGVSRAPASRYLATQLPSTLVGKYSFLGIAFLCLASLLVPLIDLAFTNIVTKTDVSDSFFDLNCYSVIMFAGAIFCLFSIIIIMIYFHDPESNETAEEILVAETENKTDYRLVTILLVCFILFEFICEWNNFILQYFNKDVAETKISSTSVLVVLIICNGLVFLTIIVFKKKVDRLDKPTVLIAFGALITILCFFMAPQFIKSSVIFSVLLPFQFTFLYFFESLFLIRCFLRIVQFTNENCTQERFLQCWFSDHVWCWFWQKCRIVLL